MLVEGSNVKMCVESLEPEYALWPVPLCWTYSCFSTHIFYFGWLCTDLCVRGRRHTFVGVWCTALSWDQVPDEHVVSTSSAHRSCHLACILSPLTCLLNRIRWWEFPAGTWWKEEALGIRSLLWTLPVLKSHKLYGRNSDLMLLTAKTIAYVRSKTFYGSS